jgi:undecaprenyl-diphosphatase
VWGGTTAGKGRGGFTRFGPAGIGGTAAFLNIIEDVLTGDSTAMDNLLLRRGHLLATSDDGSWLTPVAKALSLCGNWQVLVPLGVLLLLLAWARRVPWRVPAFYTLACAGAGALILFWKQLIDRPRPTIVPSLEGAPFASFPSGHSAYAVACFGFLLFLLWRHTRAALWLKVAATLAGVVLVTLIGASRIYLAAHFPSDVAGGLLLGAPWLLVVAVLYERWSRAHSVPDPA